MLDANRALALTTAINNSFAAIGVKAEGTKMPRSKGNLEPLAWDVFLGKHLKRMADAREKKAVAAAVKAGVMFDPEKQPMVEGTNALIYAGEVVEISVGVTTAATRFDADAFVDALEKAGVPRKTLDRLRAAHTHANRCPHSFKATLVTSR